MTCSFCLSPDASSAICPCGRSICHACIPVHSHYNGPPNPQHIVSCILIGMDSFHRAAWDDLRALSYERLLAAYFPGGTHLAHQVPPLLSIPQPQAPVHLSTPSVGSANLADPPPCSTVEVSEGTSGK